MVIRAVAVVGLLLLVPYLYAGPILLPDHVALPPSDPGLGRAIIAEPGSTWEAWFNDNRGGGDYDFNDLVLRIYFGPLGEAEVLGSVALAANVATVGGVTLDASNAGPKSFAYTAGAELIVSAISTTMGDGPYFSGAASRNSDSTIHWWTEEIGGGPPMESPEPGTFFTLGSLLAVGAFLRHRARP